MTDTTPAAPTDAEVEAVGDAADNSTIEFPNSPGVPVTVVRGGVDATTGEQMSDRWVSFSWVNDAGDTERRGFLGP